MSSLLLDALRKSDLDQYFSNFTSNGITELEALAQLSMQDYNNLGIVSIQDRKKLFQLVQSLRQELPTLENGLVSSTHAQYHRRPSRPATGHVDSSNAPYPPSPSSANMPDLATMSMSRRSTSNAGSPSLYYTPAPPSALSSTPPSNIAAPSVISRSRSRTLPDQHQRPSHIGKPTSPPQPPHSQFIDSMMLKSSSDDDDGMDDDDPPEILQRGANALLNPYGLPNKHRSSLPSKQQPQLQSYATSTAPLGQSDLNQKIRVCVRKRPLNKKEIERSEKDISPTVGTRSIHINEPKMKVDLTKYIEQHAFTFDDVFDTSDSNEKIYQRTAQPLVDYVFNGGKATCFAYGQTGSGKTYTMLDPEHGLYVLAARDVFSLLCQPQYQHLSAYIGFYEIYQGQLYDLLNARKKLFAREDGKQNVVIVGLKEYVIRSVDDLMKVFEYGSQCRSTGSTGANSDSSRSHAILQVLLRPAKNRKVITGKLSFIDLAGSERGADRGDTDVKTRMEGAEINKSLLALKECIRALDQDKRHTPFRQSKLTQVLKDSFVGRSRTCMIATISPNQSNSEHTLNTLRYADRVKELKGERDRRGIVEPNGGSPMIKGRSGPMFTEDSMLPPWQQPTTQPSAPEEEEEDGGYSDDPDLFQDHDDFLHDEDFPSDGDVRILDEDFPHEVTYQDDEDDGNASPILHQPSYLDNDEDDDLMFASHVPKRQPTPYHRQVPPSDSPSSTGTGTASGMVAATSHLQHHALLDDPAHVNKDNPLDDKASGQQQKTSRHLSSATTSPSMARPPPASLAASGRRFDASPGLLQMDDALVFDPEVIEEFIKFHRAEIRETNEWGKKETKLLTNFSLNMSSRKEDQASSGKDPALDMDRTMADFQSYLNNLDEVLDMKMAAVDALRDRIRSMLGEDNGTL
ncbi:kinesin-domain-containing protein [Hesseltinella vesiculosa]|uniref:Kinesin-like protein n=1 Tax=Hesseltinella vesiculosa TaxID=101127 RepID=A0A1X2GP77_9FUNG|nr:kinesin-domain-containing protein [Hesseltinella vesiculosa]